MKVKPKRPFSWYSLQGPDNPKSKGKSTTSTGQSEEPGIVATGSVPSTAEGSSASMPYPSSGPSTSIPPLVPSSSAYPQTALRVNRTLADINNWMQVATSKLSALSSAAASQAVPEQLQMPPSVEESLKSEEKKKGQEELKKEVAKLTSASDIPLDLLMGETAHAAQTAQPVQVPEQEADREPVRRVVIPQTEDLEIELEDPEGGDESGQPQDPTRDLMQTKAS
ncbi:uncharacterized protein [Nicotiana tomentosiformis]|uniref:uncharacterized protein n=1 Tax=Nicotiana tomentosiformis TaxID=4098 RepID=UPI00388CBD1F